MEITEELIHQIANKPLDYIHVSLMDVNSVTREGKYKGLKSLGTYSSMDKWTYAAYWYRFCLYS